MKMYAIDTSDFHTMNTQFGIMALPTLILFHNSKAVAKYNQSEFELENFAKRECRRVAFPFGQRSGPKVA